MRILDLYMGNTSPFAATLFKDVPRKRTAMNSRYAKPKWSSAFDLVSLLVRGTVPALRGLVPVLGARS